MKIGKNVKTYKTCNWTVGFSKYEFYNKLLGSITLLRVIPGVTWTQPYIYIYIYKSMSLIHHCLIQIIKSLLEIIKIRHKGQYRVVICNVLIY